MNLNLAPNCLTLKFESLLRLSSHPSWVPEEGLELVGESIHDLDRSGE